MFFYEIVLINYPIEPLVYCSEEQIGINSIVKIPIRSSFCLGVVLESVEKPDFECEQIIETIGCFFTPFQIEIAKFISDYYCSSLGLSLGAFTPHTNTKTAFKKIKITPAKLTSKQQQAVDFVNLHERSLLFGDTGSGKSEIYIALICQALRNGKNAIYLLPEIGLTPQFETKLRTVFGNLVAVWHSKLSKKRKNSILEEINGGKVRIVLGARSALFLPLYDIGIIVVDEEHDESYKSNSAPRYNTRDVALMFGKKTGAKVVLGSATPSITTIAKIPYFRLKGSFFESKKEIIYEQKHNEISDKLLSELNTTLHKNQQAIIFLPTRAHFKYVTCKNCSAVVECPFCSVAMSLHKQISALKCHYCGFTSKIIQVCSHCGSETMEATRLGTAEVVDRLREIFADKRVEKFDKDEITTEAKLNKILQSFKNGEIDILVGTQMLSKGHDYHNVGLSVVMGIDSLLAMPDFRAREKTLSLAVQIAGRSGRKEEGRVFIQSRNQEFFEKFLQNYDDFIKEEQQVREGLFPPYTKLLRLLISHKNEEKAKEVTENTAQTLKKLKNVEIVGYGKADIAKISNKYRYFILLRSHSIKSLLNAANAVKNTVIQADMDPLSFS